MNRKTLALVWWTVASLTAVSLLVAFRFAAWTYFAGAIMAIPGMLFLRTRHKTRWIYRNKKYSFTLELPAGWDKGVFESSSNLSLFGPTNELVRMGIGQLSPTPDLQTRQDDLRRMATERGQTVLEVGTIHVLGEDHATMLVDIPTIGRRKNYSLVFDDIECLVSSNAEAADDILRSYKHYVDFKKLDRFYARHGLS